MPIVFANFNPPFGRWASRLQRLSSTVAQILELFDPLGYRGPTASAYTSNPFYVLWLKIKQDNAHRRKVSYIYIILLMTAKINSFY